MWYYGIIGGIGADPGSMIARLLGGSYRGRFYMIKRFGMKRWYMFNPVLAAGFACGVGLIGMGTVAIALVSKAVIVKPFLIVISYQFGFSAKKPFSRQLITSGSSVHCSCYRNPLN